MLPSETIKIFFIYSEVCHFRINDFFKKKFFLLNLFIKLIAPRWEPIRDNKNFRGTLLYVSLLNLTFFKKK